MLNGEQIYEKTRITGATNNEEKRMKHPLHYAAGLAIALGSVTAARAETLTIATVNNGDMIIMQKLSPAFEKANPDIKLNWVVLEENALRQRVTTDIATKGGSFDILTIGAYETPIWGKQGWLLSLDDFGQDYDYSDLIPQVKAGLSVDGKMYAAPFYAESSFTMYRKDLFDKAGLKMADKPTFDQIAEYAGKLTNKKDGVYGICLRGKPGWGENMGFPRHFGSRFRWRLISICSGNPSSLASPGRKWSPGTSTP